MEYLEWIRDHFKHCAWLNPMGEDSWSAPVDQAHPPALPHVPADGAGGIEQLAKDLARGS